MLFSRARVATSLFIFSFWLLSTPLLTMGQHFSDCLTQTNTGTSATVVVTSSVETKLPDETSLQEGDELALVTNDGNCAGMKTWPADAQAVSLAVAGPQASTITNTDSGFELGEPLKFKVWDASEDVVYNLGEAVTYAPCDDGDPICRSDGTYQNDVVYTVTTLGSETMLPVELTGFDAKADEDAVLLQWTTLSETNNAGFTVLHRPPSPEKWTERGFVNGQGTTTESQDYTFNVSSLPPGQHSFRLKQVDTDGTESLSRTISVQVEIQKSYELSDVTPNPVRQQGRLELKVRQSQHVTVSLYNTIGQLVMRLRDAHLDAQTKHTITLPGGSVSSGSYFIRVRGESFSATRRAVIVQ